MTNAYVSSTRPLNVTQSRKFLENDAGFHGFSAVGVSLEFFSTWLNQINTGRQGEVAILDSKLQLLARKPMLQDSLGKPINDPVMQDFILSDLDQKILSIKSPFDKKSRIYSVRKVSGLPFVVIVGEAEDESMNHWKSLLTLSIIAVIFILIFSWIVLKNYKLIVKQKNDLIQARENLILLANYDELTKLPTRRLGIDRIRNALAMAKRNKTKVGILLIDLDGFKAVNDNYGHESGDKLLIEVAKRLSGCIREMDTIARLGGDEFIAVLPNIMKNDDVVHIADKFIKVLTETFYINEQNINIGGSIGIALYPDHEDSAEKLLSCADKAMYDIKNSGKNAYLIYSENQLKM